MANYKSIYTGAEIDSAIGKANTALQEHQKLKTINNESLVGEGDITIEGTSYEAGANIQISEENVISATDTIYDDTELREAIAGKQEELVSGTNIKTINGNSILGEGNLVIEGGEGGLTSVAHDNTLTGAGTNENPLGVDTTTMAQKSDIPDISGKQDTLVSGTNIKTINNVSILGSGNIDVSGGGDSLLTVETITKGEGDIPVTGLTLDYTELTLQTNQETRIACSVLPNNATDTRITWLSSDTSIATVEDGLVTGVAGGNATVTAKSVSNPSVTADCSVTVIGDTPTPGQKVYLYDLTPTGAGKLLNRDGHTEFAAGGGNYWEIPYSDGLYIVTGLNRSWTNNYPPFIVKVGETVTIPEYNRYEDAPYYGIVYKYDTTLTGFSSEAKVYVNTHQLNATNRDKVYYELGGNE